VSGAPLEFRQTETDTRELSDGSVASEETKSTVHRDSEGRVRLELLSGRGGPFVTISDPVDGYATVLLAPTKTAARMRIPKRPDGSTARFAILGTGLPKGNWKPDTQILPKKIIGGLECEGVRIIYTDSDTPGRTAIYEHWTAPSLGLMVLVTSSLPGGITHTARIENLVRGEPDPSLFVIPPDYTITELRDR
jgi:hypothetical protein